MQAFSVQTTGNNVMAGGYKGPPTRYIEPPTSWMVAEWYRFYGPYVPRQWCPFAVWGDGRLTATATKLGE